MAAKEVADCSAVLARGKWTSSRSSRPAVGLGVEANPQKRELSSGTPKREGPGLGNPGPSALTADLNHGQLEGELRCDLQAARAAATQEWIARTDIRGCRDGKKSAQMAIG